MIYLDHAATTPVADEVLQAMLPYWQQDFGNAASDHAWGRKAKAAVEHARTQVAEALGASAEEILLTSGATEANNLAIKGALEFRGLDGAHAVSSRTEHKCVLDSLRHLEGRGLRMTWLSPGASGAVTVAEVMAALTPQTVLVSLMWVNNETGSINPIAELAPLLRARGILLHVDAVQAFGKLPIDLATVPVDLLSISAHKFYGPKGVGALFVRKRPRARVAPQQHGGGHEQGMRSGTLATPLIVGLGAAAALAARRQAQDAEQLAALRLQLREGLRALPDTVENGGGAPHLLNLSFAGVDGEALRALLPQLAVSSGAACSSATAEPSYVLRALGRSDALANASLRFSPGRATRTEDIDTAIASVTAAVTRLRAIASGGVLDPIVLDNAFVYPPGLWHAFESAGAWLAPAGAVAGGSAEDRASGARLGFVRHLAGLRFTALGCPVLIALAVAICAAVEGGAAIAADTVRLVATRLAIPVSKRHLVLVAEDALLALAASEKTP